MRAPGSVVLFDVGGETFALPVDQVERVVRPAVPVRLPGAPADVLGVINLRGGIVTVVDPRLALDLPPASDLLAGRVLVTAVGTTPAGLLVDRVRDVRPVPDADVQPLPDEVARRGTAGVVIVDDQTVVLLDAVALLGGLADHDPVAP